MTREVSCWYPFLDEKGSKKQKINVPVIVPKYLKNAYQDCYVE